MNRKDRPMRKRDELTDPRSCMSRAQPDEWTFVLLGRDLAAPVAVRAWVEERVRLGKNQRDDPQIAEAVRWCETVEAEQATGRLKKIQEERNAGGLLGPLCDKHGAGAVVEALGVKHVASSLGVEPGPVFTNCNVCGIKLRTEEEDRIGMCERCAAE